MAGFLEIVKKSWENVYAAIDPTEHEFIDLLRVIKPRLNTQGELVIKAGSGYSYDRFKELCARRGINEKNENVLYYFQEDELKKIKLHYSHPVTQILNFLGLPIRRMTATLLATALSQATVDEIAKKAGLPSMLEHEMYNNYGHLYDQALALESTPSFVNFLRNFFGIQKDVSKGRMAWNIIKSPFVALWHLAMMPIRLMINLAKLVTELLPNFLYVSAQKLALRIKWEQEYSTFPFDRYEQEQSLDDSYKQKAVSLGYSFLYVLLKGAEYFFRGLLLAGTAITSSVLGVRGALGFGQWLYSGLMAWIKEKIDAANDRVLSAELNRAVPLQDKIAFENHVERLELFRKFIKTAGKIIPYFFAALSIAITVTFYAIAFPFALQLGLTWLANSAMFAAASSTASAWASAAYAWSTGLPTVGPWVAQGLGLMGQGAALLAQNISMVFAYLAPAAEVLGTYINIILAALLPSSISLTPAAAGFAAVGGVLTAGVVSGLSYGTDKINDWYHYPREMKRDADKPQTNYLGWMRELKDFVVDTFTSKSPAPDASTQSFAGSKPSQAGFYSTTGQPSVTTGNPLYVRAAGSDPHLGLTGSSPSRGGLYSASALNNPLYVPAAGSDPDLAPGKFQQPRD